VISDSSSSYFAGKILFCASVATPFPFSLVIDILPFSTNFPALVNLYIPYSILHTNQPPIGPISYASLSFFNSSIPRPTRPASTFPGVAGRDSGGGGGRVEAGGVHGEAEEQRRRMQLPLQPTGPRFDSIRWARWVGIDSRRMEVMG
jgi:hypothetical protein